MAVTAFWYINGIKYFLNGAADGDTDTFKCSLHTSTYTPNQDTDDFFNDCTNELGTAGNYTAGGVTLTTKTVAVDAASNEIRWDFDDPAWTTATFTARYAVFRKARGGAASADEILFYIDFGADETVSAANFTIQMAAARAAIITAA